MKLTIGIKALNEERHIGMALASAVAAARPFGGEVILADSGSSDRTIEIAKAFPVTIVQLANLADRSCGAGAQMAFQEARGEYFYLLDGDMELNADFLQAAMAYLDAHPDIAGVGGLMVEKHIEGPRFQIFSKTINTDANWLPGIVDHLSGGGLYRAAAVRGAGYFADRNLHSFEEFDLAARLQSRGWTLARIDLHAINHYGHRVGGYRLLWRRIRSGYSGGAGEVLRGAIGQPHLPVVLAKLSHLRHGAVVIAWWAALLLCLALPIAAWLVPVMLLAPIGLLSVRRGSVGLGLYSFAAWNVNALGLIAGFFRKRVPPMTPLETVSLSERNAVALDRGAVAKAG